MDSLGSVWVTLIGFCVLEKIFDKIKPREYNKLKENERQSMKYSFIIDCLD